MNLSALYISTIVVYLRKISLSSDKFNVMKTSSIENRGHLISGTNGISRIFCRFHPLQTDKKIVFDNLIRHPNYRKIIKGCVDVEFCFSANLKN